MQQHVRRDINLSPDMEERVNFGYSLHELRTLVKAGIESGPGRFASIEDIKAEARQRITSDMI